MLVGVSASEFGVPHWSSRRIFLSLTYEILRFASLKYKLSLEEVNNVRKLTLLWGKYYLASGFLASRWTFYFHTLHEHLYWELLRYYFIIHILF